MTKTNRLGVGATRSSTLMCVYAHIGRNTLTTAFASMSAYVGILFCSKNK